MKPIYKLLAVLLFIAPGVANAQSIGFKYRRALPQPFDTWHSIALPNNLVSKLNSQYTDLRVLGIEAGKDTIEAPYLLKQPNDYKPKSIDLKILNSSRKDDHSYFTCVLPNNAVINQLHLTFSSNNFDWRIDLQGSHDQQNWFELVKQARILSIDNSQTRFSFTTVVFPASNYNYYRVAIKDSSAATLLRATSSLQTQDAEGLHAIAIERYTIQEDKARKQTLVDFELSEPVPIARIRLSITDSLDYFRPVTIFSADDSVTTAAGRMPDYNLLQQTTLQSLNPNLWWLHNERIKKGRIAISNNDNLPLKPGELVIEGYPLTLLVRFPEDRDYYLYYGKSDATAPVYDLERFKDRIPASISSLQLSEEQVIMPSNLHYDNMVSKWWLWVLLLLLIAGMGWFTFDMIRKKGNQRI